MAWFLCVKSLDPVKAKKHMRVEQREEVFAVVVLLFYLWKVLYQFIRG